MIDQMINYFQMNIDTVIAYAGSGFLMALYGLAAAYLLFTEKDKRIRALFIYMPLLIILAVILPPVRYAFVRYIDTGDTYYRFLWLLPVCATIAYASEKLFSGMRLIGITLAATAVALCGHYVYDAGSGYTEAPVRAENIYHLPEEAIEVADIIMAGEKGNQIRAAMPAELTVSVRQYDTNLYLAYGREKFMDPYAEADALFVIMHEEVIDSSALLELGRERQVCFYVFPIDQEFGADPESAGLEKAGETKKYVVYKDAYELEEMRKIHFYYHP